jgi:hypothetical protein
MSGNDVSFFTPNGASVVDKVGNLLGGLTMQRLDRDGDRFHFRALLSVEGSADTAAITAKLREEMPGFEFSCVDLDDVF